ncbi:bZIP transcription factor 60 [Senna tora]|uniref:BZIP transcription factor 60 n=1 Tax=Senna tora TaxID=362788 RepID=A0A834TVS8_9FABA|nr:bZIP transcription factor 60 [Senna tora]
MDDLEFVDDDIVGQIDWGDNFDDNLFPSVIANAPPSSDPSRDSYICEIENLLMDDNGAESPSESDAKDYCDKFLADILVGEVEEDSSPSAKDVIDAVLDTDKVDAAADEHFSKKRTRKMRNRDAAVRSRERKKIYVKNLEMKSRYLEGECRKLGHLLQCCYAENYALRLCLQSGSAFGASMTKLESAVLLLESLLLGSLLWFVGIICRVILHLGPRLIQEPQLVAQENLELKGLRRTVALEGAGNKIFGRFVALSFLNSRRSRASGTKMKMIFLSF